MSRIILIFGIAAGLIVAVTMCLLIANTGPDSAAHSYFTGYLVMVLALSLIFFGVKRLRDRELGGVIRFVPALLAGLGISAVAGVIYAIGWEITLAITDYAFIDSYSQAAIEAARAKGASAAEVAGRDGADGRVPPAVCESVFPPADDLHRDLPGRRTDLADFGGAAAQQQVPAGALAHPDSGSRFRSLFVQNRQQQPRGVAGFMMNGDRRRPGSGGDNL